MPGEANSLAPMRVHLIANRRARGLRLAPGRLSRLGELARGRAEVHTSSSLEELDPITARIAEADPELVVLAGGDGSFMAGTTALARAYGARPLPRIGLLPTGTVSTVARAFGDLGSAEEQLARWLRDPAALPELERATLEVRGREGDGWVVRVGYIVGAGLVSSFFEAYEERGATGVPLAGRMVARVFVESFVGGPFARRILEPVGCALEIDGERQPTSRISLLCASVVRDLGLGMKVCYLAEEQRERIHLVASSLRPHELGPRAPRVLAGRSIGGVGHIDRLVEHFALELETERYVLDGDLLRASRIEVCPGPRVRIVTSTEREARARR
jgi:diacylglycerol kinase family enzyme